jgi:signal peptidase I
MANHNNGPASATVAAPTAPGQPSARGAGAHDGKAAGTAPAAGRATARTAGPKDTIREIIETVVFVVVLVLLLKSFVAEAFVIPTGSMAETLYGYQLLVTCPKCHEEFPVNCSCQVDPQQAPSTPVVGCICPNCRYHINFKDEKMAPSWHTGDRVLVAKAVYDLGMVPGNRPKRRDVVVFKFPKEPQRLFTPMNYIKRLIGLPGETIAINYGKIYVYDGLEYDDSRVNPLDLWEKEYTHENDRQAVELFRKGKFRMVRKSPSEMLAVRRKVFDNDHQPADLAGKTLPRWGAERLLDRELDKPQRSPLEEIQSLRAAPTVWKTDNAERPERFDHPAVEEKEAAWLRYRHLIPASNQNRQNVTPELITDFMGYNTWIPDRGPHAEPPTENWVGDLMLECNVEIQQAQGELIFELSKGVDRFRAQWNLATGKCSLYRIADGKESELERADTSLSKPGRYRLRFANFDERLTVWVDSALPFGDGVVYDPPRSRAPIRENDFEPASIGVKGAGLTVSHLKVWRDTYYTAKQSQTGDSSFPVDFGQPASWAPLADLPVTTLYVQPHHYLCLGDNSPESSDGRYWGTVPERLLLGRALLIYYPFWPISSRAGRIQ